MMEMAMLGQAGVVAGVGVLWLVLIVVGIAASVFWIWMLVDCLTSGKPVGEKLIWVLVILFLHFLGAVIYYAVGKEGAR